MTKEQRQFSEEKKQSFNDRCCDNRHPRAKSKAKRNLDTNLTHFFTKCNSKWITDLEIKCKNTKPLEDSIGENLGSLVYDDDFLDTASKACPIKEVIDKLPFIKIKNACLGEETIKKMKKQVTDWGKLFEQKKSDKETLSKTYEGLLKFNPNKVNSPVKK